MSTLRTHTAVLERVIQHQVLARLFSRQVEGRLWESFMLKVTDALDIFLVISARAP